MVGGNRVWVGFGVVSEGALNQQNINNLSSEYIEFFLCIKICPYYRTCTFSSCSSYLIKDYLWLPSCVLTHTMNLDIDSWTLPSKTHICLHTCILPLITNSYLCVRSCSLSDLSDDKADFILCNGDIFVF